MPARIFTNDKECLNCSKTFNRGRSPRGRIESIEDYRVRKFCCHNCFASYNSGENHYNWSGGVGSWKGVRRRTDGYLRYADDTYVHRRVMEEHLGRKLLPTENIHHINGDPEDNSIENLRIISNSEHRKLHTKFAPRDSNGRWCHV